MDYMLCKRGRMLAHAATAAGLALSMALGPLSVAVADTSGGATNLYVRADASDLTTPEGYGDDQIKVTMPVAMSYVADDEGNLRGPSDGAVKISNNTKLGSVHIARIEAVPESGVSLVGTAAEADGDDEVFLNVVPGTGDADTFGAYTTAKAPKAGDWDIAQSSSLELNGLTGKIGGFSTINPAAKSKFATIRWTVASGTAAEAAAEEARFTIHQVAPDNSVTDIVTTRDATAGALEAGYVWHVGSAAGTVTVADVRAAIAAAEVGASEITLYGVAV